MPSFLENYVRYMLQVKQQFFRYAVVGCSGLLIDMVLLVFVREWLGFGAVIAVIASQGVVLCYNFTLNRLWSFRAQKLSRSQVLRYGWLVLYNYFISVVFMHFFAEIHGFDYRLVRVGTVGLMVCWNFFLYKYWVYSSPEKVCSSVVSD